VLVNANGERFTDELQPAGLPIAQQPGGHAWLVFDDRVAQRYSKPPHYVSTAPGVAFAYVPDYKRHRPDLYHCAASIEALAQSAKLPAAPLAAAIETHNATLAAQESARLPVKQGPFYALGPLESRIVITDGGLAVNTSHQVLRPDGSVIARLYAAGATGQGGALLAGNGHHICWAATSGRRAGRLWWKGRAGEASLNSWIPGQARDDRGAQSQRCARDCHKSMYLACRRSRNFVISATAASASRACRCFSSRRREGMV
jgi:fumarate reductase flavoprotein subunit